MLALFFVSSKPTVEMNTNNRFLSITVLTILLSMGFLKIFGKGLDFASRLKSAIEQVQKETDKDPDTFKENVARLEQEWMGRKNPVEQSVVHAMLASAYKEMKWTHITDFDEETRGDYDKKREEHFAHVLDDMEALAGAQASTYSALLSQKGKDSSMYGGDMLSVMIDYLVANAGWKHDAIAQMYEKAYQLYQRRGNKDAYGLMKARWLKELREVEVKDGYLNYDQYKENLHQLVLELKSEEVGADLAWEYYRSCTWGDSGILFLKWCMKNIGTSRRKSTLKRELEELLRPKVEMSRVDDMLADRPINMKLRFWNCENATLTVRKYAGQTQLKDGGSELKLTGDVVEKREVVLAMDSTNTARKAQDLPVEGYADTEMTLPAGRYVFVAEGLGEKNVQEFAVSTIRIIRADKSRKTYQLYVVDNETGRPLKGVKVQWREKIPNRDERTEGWEDRDIEGEQVTGDDGIVELDKTYYVRAVRTKDDYTDWAQRYNNWRSNYGHSVETSYRIMTDRSIYRPGQTVKGSVFVYRQWGDEVEVVADHQMTLTVEDAKWKRLTSMKLRTNEYGTASFEIELPVDCEVGVLHLNVGSEGNSSAHETVRVEEYKRPTYEVKFGGPRTGKFGEVLEAEGTAMMFAGVPVQGAQVHYTVEYASVEFKRWWMQTTWLHLTEGDLMTDDEGHFRVPVSLTEEHLSSGRQVMRYRIKAMVTDVAGESHEAEWMVNASRREFALDLSVDGVVDLAGDAAFKVDAYNLNREKVTVKGHYVIEAAYKPIVEGDFTSGDSILLPKNLKLGARYVLRVMAEETNGTKVEEMDYFTPYNSALPVIEIARLGLNEKVRPTEDVKEADFIYAKNRTFEKGGAIDLFFTTKETDAYIIYNVYNIKGQIDHQVGVTDGTMKHLHLPYQESWGEGIEVDILYVRNGQFAHMVERFTLVEPEKRLKLEWATFRDKLQPGQQEQWTLTVTDKDGKRVNGAEMMSVLYDASLDRIYPHYWGFGLSFERGVPTPSSTCSSRLSFPSFSLHGESTYERTYTRAFNQLASYEHDRYLKFAAGKGRALERRAMMAVEDGDAVVAETMAMRGPVAAQNTGYADEVEEEVEASSVPEENFDNATIRENFAETAFFLPHLISDAQGNVDIQFTLPESLTEWQFMGFAHTKDVDYGIIRATAVARKEFMLRPNMPRFVRWGDKAVVASSIINQGEKTLKGAVRLRLLNPETNEVMLTQEKAFEVEAGKTIGVDFGFDVKEEWTDLDCEIIAVSGNVSDGEKNHLPVLSTKKEMVEAVPYYLIGNADGTEVSKTMDLSKLYNENSSTATHRVLKVEYTDNPAWMCIEALRSVKNPVEDDAIDFAASLYANSRLIDLMQTFPVIQKQESRTDLLNRAQRAEQKLSELQNADGGWSWFRGMSSSFYTTLTVCEHLAKLPNRTPKEAQMLTNGMKYLDNNELDSYQKAKEKKWKIWPYDSDIRYLYVSALMPNREVSGGVKKMRDEYLSKLAKAPRDLTIYGVANTAYTLRAFGHVKSADKFVDFLKDYTVEKPGQGRFFATDAAYYSWSDYRIPTQVAAMKAIYQKDKKDAILNDMQLWLISQKQVQKWDNPMNTIDVADFLLQVSPVETFHESKKPIMVVDGTTLKDMDYGTINTERDKLEGREANLVLEGNVLAVVPEEVVNDGVQQLEVKKQTPSISWGAAYATFVEEVGNLKLYATNELKIQRKLYVQHAGESQWTDFDPNQPLKVGDKVRIRHIITADRDMDFVRVSAQHPACLEPFRQLSGYQSMGGRGGYLSVRDSHFDLFFDWFTRGTSTVDMEYSVVREGSYQMGVSTVECCYAKQFGGHTEGMRMNVGIVK